MPRLIHLLFIIGVLSAAPRPMTFTDMVTMPTVSRPALTRNGEWAVYTISEKDWKTATTSSDLYLVSTTKGLSSGRRLSFTKGKNESDPVWAPNGEWFVFRSNRDAPTSASGEQQLYLMRPDGGEARKLTDAAGGVEDVAISPDGKLLAYSAGKAADRQIWSLPVSGIEEAKPLQRTKHKTAVSKWEFSPDSKRIYFQAVDEADKANRERVEKKFTAKVRNEESPLTHLWAVELEAGEERRLTSGRDYSVTSIRVSPDARWIGIQAVAANRYYRTVTESGTYSDLYLLDTTTGKIERLTENQDIGESSLTFSPDSKMLAFAAPDDFTYFRNRRLYVRPVAGGALKKLGAGYDEQLGADFWSGNGAEIYFNGGHRATVQLFAVSVETGRVRQVTEFAGVIDVDQDKDSKRLLIKYTSPAAPADYYTVDRIEDVAERAKWRRLTRSAPQTEEFQLGRTEAVQWKSTDGKAVEGVLVYPLNYEEGKRYPLIVQIHGGPAAATTLNYNASYSNYSQVYAAAGYFCLLPNYRGSANYGETHRMQISGDYFRQGYDDIMTGVDSLIAKGLVDGARMGAMGWSAGGHWSNWILTHTDRFKAISSGAGAVNWISMYAQSDVQRNREFYYGGLPYGRFEAYWDVSPLKYIQNAKTPTLIHVVDGDPRVPRPQSEELHMALRKLGVPTEFIVYPGSTHGITDMRNQMVKMVSEFRWFEKYVQGKPGWFEWSDLLDTLK